MKNGKKLKSGLKRLAGSVKKTYEKRGAYIEKGRAYHARVQKKVSQIQQKARQLQETYPVFQGTGELFGMSEPQKKQLHTPDLLGNVGGVGVIDFGLSDYAGKRAPLPKVDEQAIQSEMLEHPWASRNLAERIVRDHKKRRK